MVAYNAHRKYLLLQDGNNNDDNVDNGKIEVIFVFLDSIKLEYDSYHRERMPWLLVLFANLHKFCIRDALSMRYAIWGIPALILLDGVTGDVVMANGWGRYREYFRGGVMCCHHCGCCLRESCCEGACASLNVDLTIKGQCLPITQKKESNNVMIIFRQMGSVCYPLLLLYHGLQRRDAIASVFVFGRWQ